MKEKVLNKKVALYVLAGFVITIVYFLLSGRTLLSFIDGISICSVLFLFTGLFKFWYREGTFAFYSWKAGKLSYREHISKLKEERKDITLDILYAGIILMIIAGVLTILY